MSNKKIRRYAMIGLVMAVVLAVWGEVSRVIARSELARENTEAAIPTVATITAEPSSADEQLVLPGAVQAYMEAPIYARTNGYLKSWNTDIGTAVTKGQVLAAWSARRRLTVPNTTTAAATASTTSPTGFKLRGGV